MRGYIKVAYYPSRVAKNGHNHVISKGAGRLPFPFGGRGIDGSNSTHIKVMTYTIDICLALDRTARIEQGLAWSV